MREPKPLKHIQIRPLNQTADSFHDVLIDQRSDAGGSEFMRKPGCFDQPDTGQLSHPCCNLSEYIAGNARGLS